MRFPPASVQLRRAQLVLILAVLVPTVLLLAVGIVMLAVGRSEASRIVAGVLVLTFCGTAITGYILGSIFLGRGESLARAQSDFLSSVSHELRTPLTAIGLFMESLRDGRLAAEDQQRVLDLLGDEVARLQKLVGRLLELSRLESGAHVFERLPVEVADILGDAQAAFDASTLSRPTSLEVELDPRPGRGGRSRDPGAGGGEPADQRLEIHRRRQAHRASMRVAAGKWVEISVRDNGIGIPRHERRDIFEGFARGQEAVRRGTPGVGLGLAFVRIDRPGPPGHHRGGIRRRRAGRSSGCGCPPRGWPA